MRKKDCVFCLAWLFSLPMAETVSDEFKLRLNCLGRGDRLPSKKRASSGSSFSENAFFAPLGHRATINARAIPRAAQSSTFTLSQEPAKMASKSSIVASPSYRLRRAASWFLVSTQTYRSPAPRLLVSTQDQTEG